MAVYEFDNVCFLFQDEWGYKIVKSDDKKLRLEVFIAPDCIVSKYRLSVETVYKEKRKKRTVSYDYNKDVYILFNAWCEGNKVSGLD